MKAMIEDQWMNSLVLARELLHGVASIDAVQAYSTE